MPTFAELGVPDDLCDALDARRLTTAFPIQVVTIPPALQGRDVCGRAPTGSGKTLAFGIPLVASVERARPKRPRALVLVPTRELAAQVANDLTWLGAGRDVRVHAFYGGVRFESQIKALRRGVDIAVACPGRLADLINQGIVRLDGVDRVVIDEADRMADMGFLPEVKRLIDQTDPARQVVLFSATLDGDVDTLIERYQHDPIREDVTPDVPKVNLTHHFWTVKATERVETTADIVTRMGSTIVFTRTRHGADRVTRQLEAAGVSAVAIHGNRSQNQRERALRDFTSGRAQAMVATDVAARGIHVDAVECVVHFDLPADHKDYVHRSGRTGRAGSTGVVVALVMPDKRNDAKRLAKALDLDVETSPVVLDALPEPSEESKRTAHTHKSHSSRNRQTDRSRQGRPSRNDGGRPTFDDARPGKPRRAKHGGHNPTKGKPTNRKSSNGKPTSGDQRTGRPESRTTQDGTAGPTKARKSKPSAGKPKSGNAGFSKEGTPKKSWGPSKPGTTKSKAHKRAGGPAKRSGGRGPTNAAAGGRRPR